jgi:hypothetical protein
MKKLNNRIDYGKKVYNNAKVQIMTSKKDWVSDWMDKECVDLCNTLNSVKGITTVESCCGHNYNNYHIFFKCNSLRALKFVQACIDTRYWEYGSEWIITTYITDSKEDPLEFLLASRSKNLEEIMVQVESMIESFNYYLNWKPRFDFLGLDYEDFIFSEVN